MNVYGVAPDMKESPAAIESDFAPKRAACQVCETSSEYTEGFIAERRLVQASRTVCVTCYAYRQKYLRYYLYWLRWIALTVGIGYLLMGSLNAAVVFALGVYALTYLAIALHELGHFVTARLLGVEVPIMSFGGGLRARVFKIRRTFVILSPTPTEGLIIPVFEVGDHFRKKSLLITVAGPTTNVVMALLGFAILLHFHDQHLPNIVGDGLLLWVPINAALGIGNLSPFKVKTALGEIPSDGAQLWAQSRMSDEDIENILRQRSILRASIEFAYGDKERCLDIIENELIKGEDSVLYRTLLTAALANTGRIDRGINIGRRYLADGDLGSMERAILQNNLAFTLYSRNGPGDLDEADALSASAYELLPMNLSVKSTRGAILVGQRRYEEGVELLTDKRFRMEAPGNRATAYAIRAEGLAKLGRLDSARDSLAAAQSLESDNRHIQSAEFAIQSLTEITAA